MKPTKEDLRVIAYGESEVWNLETKSYDYTFDTEFQIISDDMELINYDPETGADKKHEYIIQHPNHHEFWRFYYVDSSWVDSEISEPEQVVKRAKIIEVWEPV